MERDKEMERDLREKERWKETCERKREDGRRLVRDREMEGDMRETKRWRETCARKRKM